ncbi:hypothetical protein QJS10_CPB12g01685 [Acorus calamus]|uniref:Uncharacterized protein n=1 Tax=Acorus calamus TaxID=4465 RepID=A0AAV9DNK4_ACOCL|nr:hypothetical protein QJS10_CPB12g01685 [Acorus calamus]
MNKKVEGLPSQFDGPLLLETTSRPAMAYIEKGELKSKKSFWRLRTITDFFWAIINSLTCSSQQCSRWKNRMLTRKVRDHPRNGMVVLVEALEVVHMVMGPHAPVDLEGCRVFDQTTTVHSLHVALAVVVKQPLSCLV